jgi:hypothetical protein
MSSREQPIKSPEENWVEQDSHQNPSMHSHSLRGRKKHSSPKKHKSAEEEEEEEDGLSENQNSSQTGFFCLPQQQKAKKQLHPRFRTVQILAKSLSKKSLT